MRQSYNPFKYYVVVDMPYEAKTVCNGCKYFEMCAGNRERFVTCPISRAFLVFYLCNRSGITVNKIPKLILEEASVGIVNHPDLRLTP